MATVRGPPLRHYAWLAGLAVATALWLTRAWSNNDWSLHYLWRVMEAPRAYKTQLSAPEFPHPRQRVWLALDAMAAGRAAEARALVAADADNGDFDALQVYALASEADGDAAAAAAAWVRAGDVSPMFEAADKAEAGGHFNRAEQILEAAHRLEPEFVAATLAMDEWLRQGHSDRAEQVLKESLAGYPTSPFRQVWLQTLGDLMFEQRRYEEAEAVFRQLLEEYPGASRAKVDLGWVHYLRGDGAAAALPFFQAAIQQAPYDTYGYRAIAHLMRREGRFAEADGWFQEAIRLSPDDSGLRLMRGNTARRAGNLELALACYQAALQIAPDDSNTYSELAWTYRLMNRPSDAIASIERALSLAQLPTAALYTRAGRVYEWAGENRAAINAYRQALVRNPSLRNVEQALWRLGETKR